MLKDKTKTPQSEKTKQASAPSETDSDMTGTLELTDQNLKLLTC